MEAFESNILVHILKRFLGLLVMLKLSLGTLDSDEISGVAGISLSVSKSLEESLWLHRCKKVVDWDFSNFIYLMNLAEKVSDLFLSLLRNLSGIVRVNALGNFNDSVVREFSSNSSNLIFLELDFLRSIGLISLFLGSSLLDTV
jgi:hypothetical protein